MLAPSSPNVAWSSRMESDCARTHGFKYVIRSFAKYFQAPKYCQPKCTISLKIRAVPPAH